MSSGRLEPHRGTLILVLGILALVVGGAGLILGPIAWILGNSDIKKIRGGTMDPEGEQQTNIGRILGMVATILNVLGCCTVLLIWIAMGAFWFAAKDEIQRDFERDFQKLQNKMPQAPAPPDFEFK